MIETDKLSTQIQMHLALWELHKLQPKLEQNGASDLTWWFTHGGAYVCTLPRRSGKTTFVQEVCRKLLQEDHNTAVKVVVPEGTRSILQEIFLEDPYFESNARRWVIVTPFSAIYTGNMKIEHLIFDEVFSLPPERLKVLITRNIKTVTATGSYDPTNMTTTSYVDTKKRNELEADLLTQIFNEIE